MFARSTTLRHPSGTVVETPILVPSFSSKGFRVDGKGESEIKWKYGVASELIADTMLVSAYDLYYKHIDPIEDAVTELTFVDSGGYEISDDADLSTIIHLTSDAKDWTQEMLAEVLDEWPGHIPAIFVNFDRPDIRRPLTEQIDEARRFFSNYRNQLNTLLIKPETKDQQYVQVSNIVASANKLGDFDIIGLTEKELGNSILDRMKRIANIRLAMDDAKVETPIHIYGSLDPITSVLYFMSGAEIFDGLTWLRYGFMDGMACYYHNFGAKQKGVGIHSRDKFLRAKMIQDNLGYLVDLKHQMQKFLFDGDYGHFDHNAELFKKSFDLLRTKNRRIV